MAGARAACALALSLAVSVLPVPVQAFGSVVSPGASLPHAGARLAGGTSPAARSAALPAAASVPPGLTLTRVSPVVAAPGQPVTVNGLLDVAELGLDLSPPAPTAPAPDAPDESPTSPPAAAPVASVEVRLGSAEVEAHDDVEAWLAGVGPSRGRVLADTEVLAGPEESAADRLAFSVTVGDLGELMPEAYGVLPVSVEVWRPGSAEPAAVVRTFVGYQERKEYEPLQLTWVVPITVPPDPALVGEFGEARTAAWEALVGEGGGLRERLSSASEDSIVWALDPALLSGGPGPEPAGEDPGDDPAGPTGTATALSTSTLTPTVSATGTAAGVGGGSATGSATESGPGPTTDAGASATTSEPTTTEPGEGDGDPPEVDPTDDPAVEERRLRVEFATLLLEGARERDVLLLPAHDADVAALPAAAAEGPRPAAVRSLIDRSLDVEEATALLAEAGATVTPTAWPAAGGWSATLDAALHDLSDPAKDPWSVLSSTSSVSGTVRGAFPSASGSTVLPYDAVLTGRTSGVLDRSSALTSALAMLADSLIRLNESPGQRRHLIVALDRQGAAADVSDELTSVLADVPWLQPAGVEDTAHDGTLVEQAPTAPAPSLLADARASDLVSTVTRLPTAASVRADGESDLASRGADTLAHLTSVRWRGHEEDWAAAYAPIGADVAETFTGLAIPSRDISFLADSGLLRVTVENSLDAGIENATLDLTVEHPILRIESGPQTVEVGADSRSTVGFEATAIASGRVSVTATLRAPDGTVLGEPTQFSVRVSPTSDWIYWVLGGLAVIVTVIGLVRMALRRRPST